MKEIRVRVGIERENCVRLDCSQKGSVRKAASSTNRSSHTARAMKENNYFTYIYMNY